MRNKVVLTVGQFIHRKGFDVLLEAWKDCSKDAELYIVGAEPTEEYQRIKEELELNNAYFVGFKTEDQLKQYYKAADLFVLSTREDIWGLVVNEAMAYMSAYFIVGLLLTKKKNRYSAIDG